MWVIAISDGCILLFLLLLFLRKEKEKVFCYLSFFPSLSLLPSQLKQFFCPSHASSF